jgi:hypothetical protein
MMILTIVMCSWKNPQDFRSEFISVTYLGVFITLPFLFWIFEYRFTDWVFGNIKNIDLETLRIYHREIIRIMGVVISIFFLSLSILWSQRDVLGTLRIQTFVLVFFFGFIIIIFTSTVVHGLKKQIETKSKKYMDQEKIKLKLLKKLVDNGTDQNNPKTK